LDDASVDTYLSTAFITRNEHLLSSTQGKICRNHYQWSM